MRTTLFDLSHLSAVLTIISALTGCTFSPKQLPPAATPDAKTPRLPVEPAQGAPDKGRVILDAVDGHARVEEVLEDSRASALVAGHYGFADAQTVRPVCTTPCAADLGQGSHRLRFTMAPTDDGFTRSHEADVTFGPNPSVYRVALRAERYPSVEGTFFGYFAMILGTSAAISGGGLMAASGSVDDDQRSDYRAAGAALLAGGAVLFVTGLIVNHASRGAVREARETQFPIGSSGSAANLAANKP